MQVKVNGDADVKRVVVNTAYGEAQSVIVWVQRESGEMEKNVVGRESYLVFGDEAQKEWAKIQEKVEV